VTGRSGVRFGAHRRWVRLELLMRQQTFELLAAKLAVLVTSGGSDVRPAHPRPTPDGHVPSGGGGSPPPPSPATGHAWLPSGCTDASCVGPYGRPYYESDDARWATCTNGTVTGGRPGYPPPFDTHWFCARDCSDSPQYALVAAAQDFLCPAEKPAGAGDAIVACLDASAEGRHSYYCLLECHAAADCGPLMSCVYAPLFSRSVCLWERPTDRETPQHPRHRRWPATHTGTTSQRKNNHPITARPHQRPRPTTATPPVDAMRIGRQPVDAKPVADGVASCVVSLLRVAGRAYDGR